MPNKRYVDVVLASGRVERANCVVNMSARWSSSIQLQKHPNMVDVDWFQWPILCLRARSLPPLSRVLVVDANGKSPTVIPHGDFITVDAKTRPPQPVHSPDATSHEDWRRTEVARELEGQIVLEARKHFAALGKLSPKEFDENSYTFWGIQGRKRHDNPLRFTGGSQSDRLHFPVVRALSGRPWEARRRLRCSMRLKFSTTCGGASCAINTPGSTSSPASPLGFRRSRTRAPLT